MGRLSIYELDSDKEPVSTLETGEYVFGRGALLKVCMVCYVKVNDKVWLCAILLLVKLFYSF